MNRSPPRRLAECRVGWTTTSGDGQRHSLRTENLLRRAFPPMRWRKRPARLCHVSRAQPGGSLGVRVWEEAEHRRRKDRAGRALLRLGQTLTGYPDPLAQRQLARFGRVARPGAVKPRVCFPRRRTNSVQWYLSCWEGGLLSHSPKIGHGRLPDDPDKHRGAIRLVYADTKMSFALSCCKMCRGTCNVRADQKGNVRAV